MTIQSLTYRETLTRMNEIHRDLEDLAASTTGELSAADDARFKSLAGEFQELNRHRLGLERREALAGGTFGRERGSGGDYDADPVGEPGSAQDRRRYKSPWNLSEIRAFDSPERVAAELRGRAFSAIEAMPGASDRVRAAATRIVERFDTKDSKLARQVLLTSSPAYMRAWSKVARAEHHLLSEDERRAMQLSEEFRAMSLTDSAGGYLVPFQLDPTVILTSDGSANDIRQFARQVVATGDTWNGVTSAAVSWSWDAEAAEVSDDAPSFGQPSIPIYKAQGFVPISIEALQDEQNVTATVAELLAAGKDDLEAVSLITGDGSGKCTGIVTALAASSPTVVVNAAADDTFALKDVYALHGALPARYRKRASWLANTLIYNLIRQFDTAGGAGLWTTLGNGTPERLLERPVGEAEAMDGTITTSGSVHNYSLIFGDFSNYVIADRIGMTVEFIPMLFHTANNRPSGQRGWYAYARMGADSVNDKGFRMLDVVSAS